MKTKFSFLTRREKFSFNRHKVPYPYVYNYFQGLKMYFQSLIIYFQGLVIYFQGLKIVFNAAKKCFYS